LWNWALDFRNLILILQKSYFNIEFYYHNIIEMDFNLYVMSSLFDSKHLLEN